MSYYAWNLLEQRHHAVRTPYFVLPYASCLLTGLRVLQPVVPRPAGIPPYLGHGGLKVRM